MKNKLSWSLLLVAVMFVLGACAKENQAGKDNCIVHVEGSGNNVNGCNDGGTGPTSIPIPSASPKVTIAFPRVTESVIRCNESLVIQGEGFVAGGNFTIRVRKVGGVYNDFPYQKPSDPGVDSVGKFQRTLPYDRAFWGNTGVFVVTGIDSFTGKESDPKQVDVVGCGGGVSSPTPTPSSTPNPTPVPTPNPPGPTPTPTPVPTPIPTPIPTPTPVPCGLNPSAGVQPSSGPVGTRFNIGGTGYCNGDNVSITLPGFGTIPLTVSGTSWNHSYNSSGNAPGQVCSQVSGRLNIQVCFMITP